LLADTCSDSHLEEQVAVHKPPGVAKTNEFHNLRELENAKETPIVRTSNLDHVIQKIENLSVRPAILA
jgi:hypothetical protein